MQHIPAMPVVGTENSWKLDFGGYHAYNITDSNSRCYLQMQEILLMNTFSNSL